MRVIAVYLDAVSALIYALSSFLSYSGSTDVIILRY